MWLFCVLGDGLFEVRVFGMYEGCSADERLRLIREELAEFDEFGAVTRCGTMAVGGDVVPVYENEFWTAKHRAGHSLHEVSYRACFKPQLPRFFIERLSEVGDLVYDPFMGRGTTLIEGALLGRRVAGCDVNPLSEILVRGRFEVPTLAEVEER